jgi:hypothetical protein
MPTVTVYLKGLSDEALAAQFGTVNAFYDAVNIEKHPQHAEADVLFRQLFRRYEPGHALRRTVTYTTDSDDHHRILENAYERFNIGLDSDPVVAEYRSTRNRSLSVGDVVVIDGTPYSCEPFGWDVLDNFPAEVDA